MPTVQRSKPGRHSLAGKRHGGPLFLMSERHTDSRSSPLQASQLSVTGAALQVAWICLTVARDRANHYYNGLPSLELIYVAQKYVNSNRGDSDKAELKT